VNDSPALSTGEIRVKLATEIIINGSNWMMIKVIE